MPVAVARSIRPVGDELTNDLRVAVLADRPKSSGAELVDDLLARGDATATQASSMQAVTQIGHALDGTLVGPQGHGALAAAVSLSSVWRSEETASQWSARRE